MSIACLRVHAQRVDNNMSSACVCMHVVAGTAWDVAGCGGDDSQAYLFEHACLCIYGGEGHSACPLCEWLQNEVVIVRLGTHT